MEAFNAIKQDMWRQINSKSFEYRDRIIKEALSAQELPVSGYTEKQMREYGISEVNKIKKALETELIEKSALYHSDTPYIRAKKDSYEHCIGIIDNYVRQINEQLPPLPSPEGKEKVNQETVDVLKKKIEYLKQITYAVSIGTRPIEDHPDPKSIRDCWSEMHDTLREIEAELASAENQTK